MLDSILNAVTLGLYEPSRSAQPTEYVDARKFVLTRLEIKGVRDTSLLCMCKIGCSGRGVPCEEIEVIRKHDRLVESKRAESKDDAA